MLNRVRRGPLPLEQALAHAWRALPPGQEVCTADGRRWQVIYPGRPNPEAGPDFVDAIFATEGGELRGDVELHRRTSDWRRHGHDADRRYRRVVLHVVAAHDGEPSLAPGGRQLPLLELDPVAFQQPPGSLAPVRFPCAARTLAGSAGDRRAMLAALAAAGDARFDAAAARFGTQVAGRSGPALEQLLYESVAEALGYSRNVAAMRTLAETLPLARVRACADALHAEALLLGSAGLLPSQRHLPAARRGEAYVAALEQAWRETGGTPALRAYHWETGRVRPENAPVRRVVALAQLARRWPAEGLVPRVLDGIASHPPAAAARALAALAMVPCPSGFWAAFWDAGVPLGTAGGHPVAEAIALAGASRAADVVVNVFLPLAAALAARNGDRHLAEQARAVYRAHPPLAENWITRLVRERAGFPAGRGDPLATARHQQGLIALYEGPCHALACRLCPLSGQLEE